MADEMARVEYAAAYEILRHYVRRELKTGGAPSLRALALDLGIPPSTLRRFMAGSGLRMCTWEALTHFAQNRPPMLPEAGTMGLAALVAAFPPHVRRAARRAVARELLALLLERGEDVPDWLAEELARI